MASKVSSINAKIGAHLAHHRKKHKKTQTEAGKVIGVTQSTYARMEQGRIAMRVDQLAKLVWAYGLSLAKFMDDVLA